MAGRGSRSRRAAASRSPTLRRGGPPGGRPGPGTAPLPTGAGYPRRRGRPAGRATVPSGGTVTVSYTVNCITPNSPPVVNAGPDESAVTGLLYSSTQSFTDANGNGPWTYRIDWGDGSVSTGTITTQGSFTVGHTY